MKKNVIVIICLMVTMSVFSKSIDQIINKYSKMSNAENVYTGEAALDSIRSSSAGRNLGILERVNSVNVLDLENCTSEVKLEFENEFKSISMDGYEQLIKVKDDDDVVILSKMKKDVIEELIIVTMEDPGLATFFRTK